MLGERVDAHLLGGKMSWEKVFGFGLIFLSVASMGYAQEYPLQLYLEKSSLKTYELSKKEKTDLLDRIEKVLERAKEIQWKLTRTIQLGETDIKYQEGQFWMSRLEEDQESIESAAQQVRILREKPTYLASAIKLYKSMKDLSVHFNSYINVPSFSASIGDVAPELELWADPVFYKLYLVPLAEAKDKQAKPSSKDKDLKEKKNSKTR